eukprot:562375-Prorocentrum_minimum.AAC.4
MVRLSTASKKELDPIVYVQHGIAHCRKALRGAAIALPPPARDVETALAGPTSRREGCRQRPEIPFTIFSPTAPSHGIIPY